MSILSDLQEEVRAIAQEDSYISWYEVAEHFNAEVVHDEIIGQSRWAVESVMVFQVGDKFFEVAYSTPATEMQETDGILDEIDSMREVKPKEITVTKYVPVTSS